MFSSLGRTNAARANRPSSPSKPTSPDGRPTPSNEGSQHTPSKRKDVSEDPQTPVPPGSGGKQPRVSRLPTSFETLEAHNTTPSMSPGATDSAAMEVDPPSQVPFPSIMETVFEGCVLDSSVTSSNFVAMLDAGRMAHVSLWSMSAMHVRMMSDICCSLLDHISTVLTASNGECIFNANFQSWIASLCNTLPSACVRSRVGYDVARTYAEDASYAYYKHAYMPQIPWKQAHCAWVLGDGNCFFNSVVAHVIGVGTMPGYPTRVAHDWSLCLRAWCVLTQIRQYKTQMLNTGYNLRNFCGNLARICSDGEFVGLDDAAALARAINYPILLLSPCWQRYCAPRGLLSVTDGVDTRVPLVIGWAKYCADNRMDCNAPNQFHGNGGFRPQHMNHFVPIFVADDCSIDMPRPFHNMSMLHETLSVHSHDRPYTHVVEQASCMIATFTVEHVVTQNGSAGLDASEDDILMIGEVDGAPVSNVQWLQYVASMRAQFSDNTASGHGACSERRSKLDSNNNVNCPRTPQQSRRKLHAFESVKTSKHGRKQSPRVSTVTTFNKYDVLQEEDMNDAPVTNTKTSNLAQDKANVTMDKEDTTSPSVVSKASKLDELQKEDTNDAYATNTKPSNGALDKANVTFDKEGITSLVAVAKAASTRTSRLLKRVVLAGNKTCNVAGNLSTVSLNGLHKSLTVEVYKEWNDPNKLMNVMKAISENMQTQNVSHKSMVEYCVTFAIKVRRDRIDEICNNMQLAMKEFVRLNETVSANMRRKCMVDLVRQYSDKYCRGVVQQIASSILLEWISAQQCITVKDVRVPSRWFKQYKDLLKQYLNDCKCFPQHTMPDVMWVDTSQPSFKMLQLVGFTPEHFLDKLRSTCMEWTNDMHAAACTYFRKCISDDVDPVQCTYDNMMRDGYCNITSAQVLGAYKRFKRVNASLDAEKRLDIPAIRVARDNDFGLFRSKLKIVLPTYECIVCERLYFEDGVVCANDDALAFMREYVLVGPSRCLANTQSKICTTCMKDIKDYRIPMYGAHNKTTLPERFDLPAMTDVECKLVALQIPYVTIVQLYQGQGGVQKGARGTVLNIPNNCMQCVQSLPRLPSQADYVTLNVHLFRKEEHEKAVWHESVRPNVVHSYMRRLCETPLYKNENITYNPDVNLEIVEDVMLHMTPAKVDTTHMKDNTNVERESDIDSDTESNDTDIELQEETATSTHKDGLFAKYGEQIDEDVLLEEFWTPDKLEVLQDKVIKLYPTANQTYAGLLRDKHSAEKCFPSIFLGQYRFDQSKVQRNKEVKRHDLLKYYMNLRDDRARGNAAFVFYAAQCIQMMQASHGLHVRLRKMQYKDKPLTAGDMLDMNLKEQIVTADVAYRELEQIYGSPDELLTLKKNCNAILRQLGHFQLFLTITSSELYDRDVFAQMVNLAEEFKLEYDDKVFEDAYEMYDWMDTHSNVTHNALKQLCVELSRTNVALITRSYVRRRTYTFEHVLYQVFPGLQDYMANDEFGARGYQHTHALLRIADVPVYDGTPESKKAVIEYIDDTCSCSKEGLTDRQLKVMTHSHIKCKKNGKCRFHFPRYPMLQTEILEPIPKNMLTAEKSKMLAKRLERIDAYLVEVWTAGNVEKNTTSIADMLVIIGIDSYQEYILAIRSKLTRAEVFLKRAVCEIRINTYHKVLLGLFNCNMDLQIVLDPYAAVEYICNYITKGPRGISQPMKELHAKAIEDGMSIPEYLQKKRNILFNKRETSLQQACCIALGLKLRMCTRVVVWVPTMERENRVRKVKKEHDLENLPRDSDDILESDLIEKYSMRDQEIYGMCTLADFASKYDPKMRKGKLFVCKRTTPAVIRFRNYNEKEDPENFYREQLMLYTSWFDENELKGDCDTYKEAYEASLHVITPQYEKYNVMRTWRIASEMARVDMQNANAFEEENRVIIDAMHDEDDVNLQYDVKKQPTKVYKGLQENIDKLTTAEFRNIVCKLSRTQRRLYEYVKCSLMLPRQLRLFLSGGAGVGKTVVTTACIQCALRMFDTDIEGPKGAQYPTVLVMSFTGTAAFNVRGNTVHSVLSINPRVRMHAQLTSTAKNTMRERYQHVRFIVIDEVSMISAELWFMIHCRLCELKGCLRRKGADGTVDYGEVCGGYHVMLVGDLFQLKPVSGRWIFQRPSEQTGTGAPLFDSWDSFSLFELVEVLRTHNRDWAELLNRVREDNATRKDIKWLQERDIPIGRIPKLLEWIAYKNETVNEYNEMYYNAQAGDGIVVKAEDSIMLNKQCVALDRDTRNTVLCMKRSDKANLCDLLKIKKNVPMEFTYNGNTNDGITNGAECTVHSMEKTKDNHVVALFVSFKNERIRKNCKDALHGVRGKWLKRVTKTFNLKVSTHETNVKVTRKQFPLSIAAARTIHRVQGLTMSKYGIDLRNCTVPPHMFYVSLSRGCDPSSIYIPGFKPEWIRVDQHVKSHMALLRETRQLNFDQPFYEQKPTNELCIISHNVRSYHAEYYRLHPALEHADVFLAIETHHKSVQTFEPLPDNMICVNHIPNPNRGIALFVRSTCTVIESCVNTRMAWLSFIGCGIMAHDVKILIIGVYKHADVAPTSLNTMMSSLMQLVNNTFDTNTYNMMCVMGDFNIKNTRAQGEMRSRMQIVAETHNLHDVMPLCHTTTNKTTIDYMLTSSSEGVLRAGVYPCELSDHHMLYSYYDMVKFGSHNM